MEALHQRLWWSLALVIGLMSSGRADAQMMGFGMGYPAAGWGGYGYGYPGFMGYGYAPMVLAVTATGMAIRGWAMAIRGWATATATATGILSWDKVCRDTLVSMGRVTEPPLWSRHDPPGSPELHDGNEAPRPGPPISNRYYSSAYNRPPAFRDGETRQTWTPFRIRDGSAMAAVTAVELHRREEEIRALRHRATLVKYSTPTIPRLPSTQ